MAEELSSDLEASDTPVKINILYTLITITVHYGHHVCVYREVTEQ